MHLTNFPLVREICPLSGVTNPVPTLYDSMNIHQVSIIYHFIHKPLKNLHSLSPILLPLKPQARKEVIGILGTFLL